MLIMWLTLVPKCESCVWHRYLHVSYTGTYMWFLCLTRVPTCDSCVWHWYIHVNHVSDTGTYMWILCLTRVPTCESCVWHWYLHVNPVSNTGTYMWIMCLTRASWAFSAGVMVARSSSFCSCVPLFASRFATIASTRSCFSIRRLQTQISLQFIWSSRAYFRNLISMFKKACLMDNFFLSWVLNVLGWSVYFYW